MYLQKIKEICTKLALVDIPISADEVFLHVVHGLPSEYDSIASSLRARQKSITFQELHDKLTDCEAHLTRRSSKVPIMENIDAKPRSSTNLNSNRGANNSRSNQRNFSPSN
uniref:Uncharacterized protein n=1 Tax=Solanum lycopersicum TaxID=4081 RepID=A0A3Q7HCC2_SOLLC